MPTWGAILAEIGQAQAQGNKAPADFVRKGYIAKLSAHTGRNTILYASKWTMPTGELPGAMLSINEEDVHGLMEVVHGLKGNSLDLILHSPGGSAEATDAAVSYLRSKFTDIRTIVPHAAMSAATMLACASNRIVMGKHSSLGPIDPQMLIQTPLGGQAVPAQAILDQFAMAQEQCRDPELMASWLPMLNQYGPALLIQCKNALHMSQELVSDWLATFMFAGKPDAKKRAKKVAAALADHGHFKSHGKHINRDQARVLGGAGLIIEDLEADQTLQDLVLSVYHATSITLGSSACVKMLENQQGKGFYTQAQMVVVQQPKQPATGTPGGPSPTPIKPSPPPPGPPQGH